MQYQSLHKFTLNSIMERDNVMECFCRRRTVNTASFVKYAGFTFFFDVSKICRLEILLSELGNLFFTYIDREFVQIGCV